MALTKAGYADWGPDSATAVYASVVGVATLERRRPFFYAALGR